MRGTSLAVQWLRLCPANAGGAGSIPGWGAKIPACLSAWPEDLKKKKKKSEGKIGTSLVVPMDHPMELPWLHTPNAGGLGSIPGQRSRSHMPRLRPGAAK